MILATFDLQVTLIIPASFSGPDLSVQENKFKKDFKDGNFGDHTAFPITTILASFDLQVTQILPTKFQVTGLSVQEKKRKMYLQDGGHGRHFGFPIGTILDIFYLQVTLMLSTMFRVNWPFGSEVKAKTRFPRWRPLLPSWTSDRNDVSQFSSTSHPSALYHVSCQLTFYFRRKSKN